MARKVPRSRIPSSESQKPTALPKQGRKHSNLRDRLFYIGVALGFAALGIGVAVIAPVMTYDCQRDASGAVNCTVHRRVYGVVPLPAQRLSRIVSAKVEEFSSTDRSFSSQFRQIHDVLILGCADGTQWKSLNSSQPLGQSNPTVASGIEHLLTAESPQKFHAWQGEKVPLLVGTVFLVPAMIVVLAFLLRILLLRNYDPAGLGGLMSKFKK